MNTSTFRDRVAQLFKDKPNVWIDAHALQQVGGQFAWRTRVSEVRRSGMTIKNQQRRQTDAQGRRWTLSLYCYEPPAEPVQQPLLRETA